MAPLTWHQRGIWELPAAALRDWHRASSRAELSPWCHTGHPSPSMGTGARRHPLVQQPGVLLAAASRIKDVMARLASAGTPVPAPCPTGSSTLGRPQAPRRTRSGSTLAECGLPQCCPAAVAVGCAGGQRWRVLTQACTMGSRQVGTGPRCCSVFAVHHTHGVRVPHLSCLWDSTSFVPAGS